MHTCIFEAKPIHHVREHDKENFSDGSPICISVVGSQKVQDDDLQESSPQLPELPLEKQCPQTPANRIPLADLIGNTEDAFNCDPKATTPEDHIYWQHGPAPRSSVPSATANRARRRKKRARSSSPASSSQNQKSTQINAQESPDLKSLHESQKIPHNDPALDLWARYTDATLTKKDADGKPLPAYAHLMTSSPQTPSTTNNKDSGLRRSISCGTEWPASKAKRRKVGQEVTGGRLKDTFAASKTDILAPGKSKSSRISLLMEKLQENSKKVPTLEVSGPSSSSPLPDRIGLSYLPFVSPVAQKRPSQQENDEVTRNQENHQPIHDILAQRHEESDSHSSDFGDEDLALDLLEAVEQSTCTQAALPAAAKRGVENPPTINDAEHPTCSVPVDQRDNLNFFYKPSADKLLPASESLVAGHATALANVGRSAFDGDDDDEFGDGSDDNGVMADLAAQFDTQQTTCSTPPHLQVEQARAQQHAGYNNHPTPAQVGNDEDDNAYDDYNDDDLWNHIGDGSLVLQQNNSMATASQVRVIL